MSLIYTKQVVLAWWASLSLAKFVPTLFRACTDLPVRRSENCQAQASPSEEPRPHMCGWHCRAYVLAVVLPVQQHRLQLTAES